MSDYMPPELISNILARLPVDDLLRFTSVCKSWYSLITSSDFISLHRNLSVPNQEPRLFIRNFSRSNKNEKTIRYTIHRNNQTFDEIANHIFKPSRDSVDIVGSCNGIFCFSCYSSKRIILWNPSIKKKLVLRYPIEIPELDSSFSFSYALYFGFGFVPATNDYKIVKMISPRIDVYKLSTNSWHNVDGVQDISDSIHNSKQVVLNSRVHWVSEGKDNRIVSFDLTSEKVGTLMFPNCLMKAGSDEYEYYYVMSYGESLCVLHAMQYNCNIWVMKEYGVAESWELQFNIPDLSVLVHRPLYFQDGGKLLFTNRFSDYFDCYDPISRKIVHIRREEQSAYAAYADRYVESLVLLKSFNTSKRIENLADWWENVTIKKARLKK